MPYSKPLVNNSLFSVFIVKSSTIFEVKEGVVIIQDNQFEKKSILADTVISCKLKSNRSLYNELIKADVNVFNVGDSLEVRELHPAVREGAAFGLNLDENMMLNSNNAVMNNVPIDVLQQLKR